MSARTHGLAVLLLASISVAFVAPCVFAADEEQRPKITQPTLRPGQVPVAKEEPATPEATTSVPEPTTAGPAAVIPPEEPADITFKFQNQPLADVLKLYSDLTKRTVIQNSSLQGTVTIEVKTPLTRSEAILALESVLFANGVSVTPMGEKFVKAAANPVVAREGVALAEIDPLDLPEADRIMAQIIALRYLDVADTSLIQSLTQFIHQPGGTLLPLSRSNSLLIIDTALNVKRLQQIIDTLDQPVENRVQTKIYQLKNARASEVASTVQTLISTADTTAPAGRRLPARPQQRGAATPTGPTEESIVVGKVTIQPDERTNQLIVMSRPSNYEFLDELIEELDRTVDPELKFKAFKLQHAKADEVAELILALTGSGAQPTIQPATTTRTGTRRLGESGSLGARRATSRPTTTAPQQQLPPILSQPRGVAATAGRTTGVAPPEFVLSERARIFPDSRQGSVLLLGTSKDVELVERIVPQLDLALAQVLIESVIAEILLNDTTDFGVNILQREFNKKGITGAGASLPIGSSSNLFVKAGALTDPSKFSTLMLSRGLTYFASFDGLDLDAVVVALAQLSNFKVLQTPMIQSSQNQEAHIFIGETRPIVTATQTGFSSGDETIPVRSSIEQFDIGITLDIIPNITPGGLVELELSQAVEDVTGSVIIDGNEQPIVARRELSSIISVRDGGVIVLGGLIRNTKIKGESKVPIVGDWPILGHLFKQTRWENVRSELVVLLRPTVMRSAEAAELEARKKRDEFKGLDNIPKETLPPLPKEPEPKTQQPWYGPLVPPKD